MMIVRHCLNIHAGNHHLGPPRRTLWSAIDCCGFMQASNYLEAVGEFMTKNILEELLTDEEGHIGFLETQRDLV